MPPARAQFDPLRFHFQEGIKVDAVWAFEVEAEAIIDSLDEKVKLDKSTTSSCRLGGRGPVAKNLVHVRHALRLDGSAYLARQSLDLVRP
jgi:hypothetical protein